MGDPVSGMTIVAPDRAEELVSFDDGPDVQDALKRCGYIADDDLATVVHLATALDRPLLLEGPAGVGTTELAKALAQTGAAAEAWQKLAPALAQGYPDEKGSLHYLLGTVLRKMGRTAEAEQAFAAATQISEAVQQKSYRDQDPDAQPQ